ncbi:MAG: phosphate ABC transporter permease subunit PstC [Elusimicrobiota bacterium]|jgi:phosphate transport system permease protein
MAKRSGRRRWEALVEGVIYLSALTAIVALFLIFVFIGKEALPILTSPEIQEEANLSKLFLLQDGRFSWQPVSVIPKYSLLPLFVGTLKATAVAMLFAIPLALGAALFSSEFAPSWMKELIKPVIELLAGIPSVVLGFFALMVMATYVQEAFGMVYRLNAINAGIALGLAVIPIVYTVADDALTAVPRSYREASIAMGASSWQTAARVVFPAALPGILAACVLGFGRAIGETMIVLMASGNAPVYSLALDKPIRTLSATVAAELGEVVVGSAHYHVLFFVGICLFIFTFVLNLFGHWFVNRLQQKVLGSK